MSVKNIENKVNSLKRKIDNLKEHKAEHPADYVAISQLYQKERELFIYSDKLDKAIVRERVKQRIEVNNE